nr:hypothetical protein Ade03nite_66580 [Actinoplanes derwentensis]
MPAGVGVAVLPEDATEPMSKPGRPAGAEVEPDSPSMPGPVTPGAGPAGASTVMPVPMPLGAAGESAEPVDVPAPVSVLPSPAPP